MLKKSIFITIFFSLSWVLMFSQTNLIKGSAIDSAKKENEELPGEIKLSSNLREVEVTGIKERSYKNENSFSYTKTEMPVKDIPQSISSVTKELIQDRQALRLKEIIQHVAGVNEFSVYDEITMRGFRSSGTHGRLLNGLRTYNNYWTSPLLVTIERVEFIKGPASAVFANTNPGGTVNMVTKKPLDERRHNLSFTTGSFNSIRAMGDFTGPLKSDKTLLYRLNVGYENAETFRENISNKSFVVATSISFLPTERTRFNADFIYTNVNTALDRGRPTIQNAKDLFSTPISLNVGQPGDFLKQQSVSLIFSFNHKLTEKLSFNISYLKIRHDERLNEHQFGGYITPDSIRMNFTERIVKFNGNNLAAYLVYKLTAGALEQTIIGGYDYIDGFNHGFNRYARNMANGVPNMSLTNPNYSLRPVNNYTFDAVNIFTYGIKYRTQGVYLQDLIKYKRFQFLLSLRQEFHHFPKVSFTQAASNVPSDQQQNALLPRVGLTYGITSNINVYATYATGFEPQAAGTLVNPISGGPFDPLTSELIEAGSKGEFFRKRLLASVAIYQITQNNVLVSALDTINPYLLKQRGQEQGRGYEIEAAGRITSNLVISINYAFNETRITKDTEGDVKKLVGLVKENAPKHMSGS